MKKIISIILALALTLSALLVLASCGDTKCTDHKDDNNDGICDTEGCGEAVEKTTAPTDFTVNYEVTVKDAEGNAIEGAVVVITSQYDPSEEATTGANGKAALKLVFDEDPGFFKAYAVVKSVPSGYEIPDRVLIEEGKATVVVEEAVIPTDFTVKLVGVDGAAVKLPGVSVQICQSTCLEAGATDENGELRKSFVPEEANFKIKLTNLATFNYTIVEELNNIDADGYVIIPADKTVFEIVIKPVA